MCILSLSPEILCSTHSNDVLLNLIELFLSSLDILIIILLTSATEDSSSSLSPNPVVLLFAYWGVTFPCLLFFHVFLFCALLMYCWLVSWGV
jgi:hypothetical protein